MRRILFVIPSLDHGGAARQLSLLVPALPRDRIEPRVCVLRGEGAFAQPLRRAGVAVESLGWRHWLELGAIQRMRGLLEGFRPDVVHAWQPAAVRLMRLLPRWKGKLLVSSPLPVRAGTLDRWLLRRSGRVIAVGQGEAGRCGHAGIAADRIISVRPAVAPARGVASAPRELDPSARLILCIGPLEPHKGFRDAVWTFDILRYVEEQLSLWLIGDGSDRAQLERFIGVTRTADQVRLLGPRDDVADLLERADVVWVPSLTAGGVNAALEAMAAGTPVVATRLPGLAEVIRDGHTGFLIEPGDKVALARKTRQLLADADRRREMGAAARQHVAEQFSVAELVERLTPVYEGAA